MLLEKYKITIVPARNDYNASIFHQNTADVAVITNY